MGYLFKVSHFSGGGYYLYIKYVNIMKYLHLFEDYNEFKDEYLDDGGPAYFTCSGGTYNYDRDEYDQTEGVTIFYWKNGDSELITLSRNARVGTWNYSDGTGAYDIANDNDVEILTVGERVPGKYDAPWVSFAENGLPTKFTAHINGTISGVTYNGDYEFIIGPTKTFTY